MTAAIYVCVEATYLLFGGSNLPVDSTPYYEDSTPLSIFLVHYVVMPGSLMVVALVCAELFTRYGKIEHGYINVVLGTVVTSIIMSFNPNTLIIAAALFYPVFISATYLNKRIIIFSASLSVFTFFLLFALVPDIRYHTGINNAVGLFGIGVASALIALSNMKRNVEIMDSLVESMIKEQCLIVKQEKMEVIAKTDALTGLNNHKTFQENFEKNINICFFPMQLAIVDIDNFKRINDTYGHQKGDLVLRRVSQIIKDTVGPDDLASRYGGEEFAIIMKGKEFSEAYELVENIRIQISNLKHPELNQSSVTVSIGLQQYVPGHTKDAFFEKTDSSLYLAKRSGKNRTVTQ